MNRQRTPLTVLPSRGVPATALGVELFLPLFLRWREAHDLPNIESRSLVPEVEQGQVRRLDRRPAA